MIRNARLVGNWVYAMRVFASSVQTIAIVLAHAPCPKPTPPNALAILTAIPSTKSRGRIIIKALHVSTTMTRNAGATALWMLKGCVSVSIGMRLGILPVGSTAICALMDLRRLRQTTTVAVSMDLVALPLVVIVRLVATAMRSLRNRVTPRVLQQRAMKLSIGVQDTQMPLLPPPAQVMIFSRPRACSIVTKRARRVSLVTGGRDQKTAKNVLRAYQTTQEMPFVPPLATACVSHGLQVRSVN